MYEIFCKAWKDFVLEIFRDLNDFVLSLAKSFWFTAAVITADFLKHQSFNKCKR